MTSKGDNMKIVTIIASFCILVSAQAADMAADKVVGRKL